MTRITRNIPADCCCDSWKKGIRTINGQYPDDNREFGIVEGAGILITPVTAGIKITNASDPGALQAGQNIQLTPVGDHLEIATTDNINVNGNLNVDGDIIQQGASYETHMEQVYTTNDYIIMRDGAVAALPSGDYAGFQVKKYDGTNDGRLVIDNTGTARVGDVGDEKPLLLRAEANVFSSGDILEWSSSGQNAIPASIDAAPTNGSNKLVRSGGVYTALAGKQDTLAAEQKTYTVGPNVTINASYSDVKQYGKIVFVTVAGIAAPSGTNVLISGIPKVKFVVRAPIFTPSNAAVAVANDGATAISIYATGAISDGSTTFSYLTE